MKQAIFDALQTARAEKRAVVLATALKDGRQSLIDGEKSAGDLPVNEALRAAARRALRDDKSHTIETEHGPVFVQAFNTPLRMLIVGAVWANGPRCGSSINIRARGKSARFQRTSKRSTSGARSLVGILTAITGKSM